jgi:hypothetical protein
MAKTKQSTEEIANPKSTDKQTDSKNDDKISNILMWVLLVLALLMVFGAGAYWFWSEKLKTGNGADQQITNSDLALLGWTVNELTAQDTPNSAGLETPLAQGSTILKNIAATAKNDYSVSPSVSLPIVTINDDRSTTSYPIALSALATDTCYVSHFEVINSSHVGISYSIGSETSAELGYYETLEEIGVLDLETELFTVKDYPEEGAVYAISFIDENNAIVYENRYLESGDDYITVKKVDFQNKVLTTVYQLQRDLCYTEWPFSIEDFDLSVSPSGNYAYLVDTCGRDYVSAGEPLNDTPITVIDLFQGQVISEIHYGTQATWVGNSHILYTDTREAKGVNIYSLDDNKLYSVDGINSKAINLQFYPDNGGVIAYSVEGVNMPTEMIPEQFYYDSKTVLYSCSEENTIDTLENSELSAVSSSTQIIVRPHILEVVPAEFADDNLFHSGLFTFWDVSDSRLGGEFSGAGIATEWTRY